MIFFSKFPPKICQALKKGHIFETAYDKSCLPFLKGCEILMGFVFVNGYTEKTLFLWRLALMLQINVKEIEIIHRLFLVIAMYCQASSSQFNESRNLPRC